MRQNPEGFQFPSVLLSLTEPLPCTWIRVALTELGSRDPQGDRGSPDATQAPAWAADQGQAPCACRRIWTSFLEKVLFEQHSKGGKMFLRKRSACSKAQRWD